MRITMNLRPAETLPGISYSNKHVFVEWTARAVQWITVFLFTLGSRNEQKCPIAGCIISSST